MLLPAPLVYILVALVAFLLGSIPFGVIIGKLAYGSDPRDGGSGSIGATNMNRLYGWKAALGTFVGDVGKGALAVAFARAAAMFMAIDAVWQFDLLLTVAILCSILGHVFCPWLGFHGGKGISTGLGSIIVGYPLVVICMLLTFLVVAFLSRRISAGSICAAISFPVFSYIFCGLNVPLLTVSVLVMVAVVYAHRSNIKRIFNGTEPKFSFNRSKDAQDTQDAQDGDAK
jgi:glycerol-3-phosphate acyltransferase PlsY